MTKAEAVFEKIAISGAMVTKAIGSAIEKGKPMSKINKNIAGMEKSITKGFVDKAGKVRAMGTPKYKQWADKADAVDAAAKTTGY